MFFLFFAPFLFGQENLILNGDFEEYWECPDDATQIERCKYVYNPLPASSLSGFYSSSDYLNSCSLQANVPNTLGGYQNAYSGSGLIGLYNLDNYSLHYREYAQVSFSNVLECGKNYTFQGYFNIGDLHRYTLKNIGFYFSENEIEENDYLFNLYTPQFIDENTEIVDTANWTLIKFDFIADKNYRYLTIGHFENDGINSYLEFNPNAVSQGFDTYLLIDSVSLIESKDSEIKYVNVFTPNDDGINDMFFLPENLEWFNQLLIINRWGNQVATLTKPFQWDGTSNNDEMPEGVYFYMLIPNKECESKKNTKYQGMIHLMR